MAVTTVTEYINYIVYFTDQAMYNFAFGLNNSTSCVITPSAVAAMFSFAEGVNYSGDTTQTPANLSITNGMIFNGLGYVQAFPTITPVVVSFSPSLITADLLWNEIVLVNVTGNTPHAQPTTVALEWCATFVFQPANTNTAATTVSPIPLRRWIQGWEYNGLAEGASSEASNYNRDSSRTVDGVGFALRNSSNINILRSLTQYITPTFNYKSWERFYIRIRQIDSGNQSIDIWRSVGFPSSNSGILININSDLSLSVYNVNVSNVQTLLQQTASILTLDSFAKIDIYIVYNNLSSGGSGAIVVWVDGVEVVSQIVVEASGGIGGNSQYHEETRLGTTILGSNTWEIDIDDWHNAEVPQLEGVDSFTNVDFLVGTHVRRHNIDSGTATDWVGDLQSSNQMIMAQNVAITSEQTSSTASATIQGLTDANDTSDPSGIVFCASAAMVSTYGGKTGGTATAQLGYNIAGAGYTTGNIPESGTLTYKSIIWPGSGATIINQTIVPLSIEYIKSNDTTTQTIVALAVEVQYVGMWGVEDGSQVDLPRLYITHNAWFPTIAQAFLGPTPGPAMVAAQGGTYVGTGTDLTIAGAIPPHFIYIRPVSSTNPGSLFFGASLGGHINGQGAVRPDLITRMDYDESTGEVSVTLVGSAVQCNALGTTYQYIVFCDPAFQYNLCGAYQHGTGVLAANNPLIDPNFTPLAAFISFEYPDNDTTVRLIYKGPGHSGTDGTQIDGTDITNAGQFSTGNFISGANAQNADNNQMTYSLWKAVDNCSQIVIQAFAYTGDGTGTKVITCTPTSGRYPLLAYVQPHNSVGIIKDPSDVTTSSRQITSGAATASGITAVGIDSITVASTLNTDNIVYDVFIILGDSAGFNNGTFYPSPCQPDPLVPTPTPPIGLNIFPIGGIEFNGDTAKLLLKDISGIYTIVVGQTHDELYDRQTGQTSVDVAIPDPNFKTGYIGG